MKFNSIVFFLAVTLVTSCNDTTKSKTERKSEPDIHNVESSDQSMNNAILEANQTIDSFEKALLSENLDYDVFSLKQKFDIDDGGGEHIWIQDVKLIDSNYFGVLGNEPVYIKNIKLGDTIKVDKNG